ncbi:type II secretion system minor pseudopilin GspI [Endozoicomonas sp. Mp262]|uniref:type II secretion system minor pseudopilin GspI n=1 Tax=Endozoicomonas sp. Mp262 TaxID=2919499 RepID=UPI0021DAE65D
MSRPRLQSGFTLIEVLMALAILAIAGMTMLRLAGENIRNTGYIEQKTIARWVADNQLTSIRLSRKWPGTHWKEARQEMTGRTWYIRYRSIKTTQDDFRAVEVEVRTSRDDKEPPLAFLQTYMVQG